jgi:competence protein ComEA
MRRRPSTDASVAEVTRRRLDALSAELAATRGEVPPPSPARTPDDVPEAVSMQAPGRHAYRPVAAQGRLAGWLGDRLPPALQGRAHLGAAQFGLVALVVAVGLVIGAWWLVRAGGSSGGADEVAPPRPAVTSSAPAVSGSTTGSGAATPSAGASEGPDSAGDEIVVDVVGKARRPGIAVLPAGARVVDAVRAAGGMRPGVDPATVNMARPLADGEQIVIGLPGVGAPSPAPVGTTPPSTGGPPSGALVNLNTADQAALETLPGVGPVTAAAILEWRAEHGGFTSVDELLEVSGIGEATLAEIAPHVTL